MEKQVNKLEKEKSNHKKGFFRKAFGKSIELIEQELERSNKSLNRETQLKFDLENKSNDLKKHRKKPKIRVKNLKSSLENENFKELEKKIEDVETALNDINAQISKLNKEMEGLRKKLFQRL